MIQKYINIYHFTDRNVSRSDLGQEWDGGGAQLSVGLSMEYTLNCITSVLFSPEKII